MKTGAKAMQHARSALSREGQAALAQLLHTPPTPTPTPAMAALMALPDLPMRGDVPGITAVLPLYDPVLRPSFSISAHKPSLNPLAVGTVA